MAVRPTGSLEGICAIRPDTADWNACRRLRRGLFRLRQAPGEVGPLIAGVFLCIYPYFIESVLWLSIVGILLLAAPFVIDY